MKTKNPTPKGPKARSPKAKTPKAKTAITKVIAETAATVAAAAPTIPTPGPVAHVSDTAEVAAPNTMAAKAMSKPPKPPKPRQAPPQKKGGLEVQGFGLSDLKTVVRNLTLAVPKLDLPDISGIDADVERKIQLATETQAGVANALKWLKGVNDVLSKYRDNRLARKIIAAETKTGVDKMDQYVKDALAHKYSPFRTAAGSAYIVSALTQDIKDCQMANDILHDLEAKELLVKTGSEGPIIIGYQHYKVSDKFGMEPEDIADFSTVIANFSRTLKTLIHQQREQDTTEAREAAEVTLKEAMADSPKNGTCLIDVPAQSYMDGNTEKWRAGGQLLVRFTDDYVTPIQGIGAFETVVKEMVSSKVRIRCVTLDWNGPGEFEKSKTWAINAFNFNDEQAIRYVNLERTLWHLVRRGVQAMAYEEQMDKLREEFRGKTTITPVQFFGLNGSGGPQKGTAHLEFQGSIKEGKATLIRPFLLAQMDENDGKHTFEIVGVPPHLRKSLGDCASKTFPVTPGFSDCPPLLRRILNSIRGQAEMNHEIAGK